MVVQGRCWLMLMLGLGSAWSAVEPQVLDLRLVAGARPAAFTYTWSDGLRSGAGEDGFTSAGEAGLGLRWGLGPAGHPDQLLLSAEALAFSERQAALDHRGAVLRLGAGWVRGLDERWSLSLLPTIGLARGRADLVTGVGPDLALAGTGVEAALAAGLRLRCARRWAAGLEGSWCWGRESLSGDGGELELRRSGPAVALSLAWIIDPRPRVLDDR